MFVYTPLWATLAKLNIKKTDLLKNPGLSSSTLAKMGKNEYVSLEILNQICTTLNCEIEEVVKHVKT